MASLARQEITVLDQNGKPVSGASVEIRSLGAQVNRAQSGTPLAVDDVGAILTGDLVRLNATSSPTRTATVSSGTSIALSGGDLGSVSDDDRISDVTLPTIYEDEVGNTSTPNPLTTDANGYASCYVVGGKNDILISGGGLTPRLLQSVAAVGGESTRSNVYNSGSAVAWILDTLRTLTGSDKLFSIRNNTTEKFYVDRLGQAVASGGLSALAGGLVVASGNISNTGSITSSSTITATAGGITATTGDLKATAGNVVFNRVKATQGTNVVTGDFLLSAGWGNTATIDLAEGNDTRGRVLVTCNGAGIAANPNVTLTFHDGTFTSKPFGCTTRSDTNAPFTGVFQLTGGGPTPTACVVTFMGLPEVPS